jgi:acetoin utilization protein AcuB
MLVRDWMTPDPHVVPPTTPVLEAMQMLRDRGFRRLPVVQRGRLLGIVTDRDLKEATPSKATSLSVYELNYLLARLTLADVMRTPVITIAPDEPIEQAALTMESHRVSGLPVTERGVVVGILTISDLLRAFVDFLGLREGGRRVSIEVPDAPGALARIAAVAPPSNVVAVVTAGVAEGAAAGALRRLVLRVEGEAADGFADRLRAIGVTVRDVR